MSGKDAKGGSMTGTPDRENNETFEGYAVLELMGHRRLAGWVTEQEIAGAAFLRIDVLHGPTKERDVTTQFYSAGAVYCITPTTEEVVRAAAKGNDVAPVSRWELRELEPARAGDGAAPGYYEDDEDEEEPF